MRARIESVEAAEVLGRRLRAAFDLPVAYGPLQLAVGGSIGAAIFPVHGSDSPEAAQRELGIYFKPEELISWATVLEDHITAADER